MSAILNTDAGLASITNDGSRVYLGLNDRVIALDLDELSNATQDMLEVRERENIMADLPQLTKNLMHAARLLIGNDLDTVDPEYIRAQVELIADVTGGVVRGLEDSDAMRDFIEREVTGR